MITNSQACKMAHMMLDSGMISKEELHYHYDMIRQWDVKRYETHLMLLQNLASLLKRMPKAKQNEVLPRIREFGLPDDPIRPRAFRVHRI